MTCRICPTCGDTMDCGGRGTVCDRCDYKEVPSTLPKSLKGTPE